jgi:GTP:adenosylcobinamide-phosphate guanylyltransferase
MLTMTDYIVPKVPAYSAPVSTGLQPESDLMKTPSQGFYSEPMGQWVSIAVVVLAGDRSELPQWVVEQNVSHKLLVPLADEPLIGWTLKALMPERRFSSLSMACNHPQLIAFGNEKGLSILPSGNSGFETMSLSIKALEEQDFILFVSGDHALLTPEMLQHFIQESLLANHDLSVGIVSREQVQAEYPDAVRTFFPFKNQLAITGANLFLFRRASFVNQSSDLAMFETNRKFQWSCLKAFSPWFALKILFRQLTVAEAAEYFSQRFGLTMGGVLLPFAEAAIDVDKQSDFVLVQHILENRLVDAELEAHLSGFTETDFQHSLRKTLTSSPKSLEEDDLLPAYSCC